MHSVALEPVVQFFICMVVSMNGGAPGAGWFMIYIYLYMIYDKEAHYNELFGGAPHL